MKTRTQILVGLAALALVGTPATPQQGRKKAQQQKAAAQQRQVFPPKPGSSSDTINYVRVSEQPSPRGSASSANTPWPLSASAR